MSKKMSQEIFIKLYWGSILMTGTMKGINKCKDAHSLQGVYDLENRILQVKTNRYREKKVKGHLRVSDQSSKEWSRCVLRR